MEAMRRTLRTLAAVLAGLALVAALPAPCGCMTESATSRHTGEHECCAPPAGVSAAARGCCDETPEITDAVPLPAGPAAAPSLAVAVLGVEAPPALRTLARSSVVPATSPPPTVLRI
jgi:hypothetical protein